MSNVSKGSAIAFSALTLGASCGGNSREGAPCNPQLQMDEIAGVYPGDHIKASVLSTLDPNSAVWVDQREGGLATRNALLIRCGDKIISLVGFSATNSINTFDPKDETITFVSAPHAGGSYAQEHPSVNDYKKIGLVIKSRELTLNGDGEFTDGHQEYGTIVAD